MQPPDPAPPPDPQAPSRFPTPVLALAVFGAALAAYWPVLRGGILWDDAAHITAPALQNLGGLWRIWFRIGDPAPPPDPQAPSRFPTPVLALAVFGAALAAYWPVLRGGILWDDAAPED